MYLVHWDVRECWQPKLEAEIRFLHRVRRLRREDPVHWGKTWKGKRMIKEKVLDHLLCEFACAGVLMAEIGGGDQGSASDSKAAPKGSCALRTKLERSKN